jgi:hypothetical protein
MMLLLISCQKLHQARYTVQIKGHNISACLSSCVKFCTIMYCSITLLQLLYR